LIFGKTFYQSQKAQIRNGFQNATSPFPEVVILKEKPDYIYEQYGEGIVKNQALSPAIAFSSED